MENKTQGYKVREYHGPVKRYCQMLSLKDDPALIAEYRNGHSEVGRTPLDFDWDTAMAKMATLPRQEEWENYMSVFQQAEPGASSAEKWQLMDRMFHLYI